mmetsp:Transcript_14976/g.20945  ORF Transcript_14976/g.20945 Transcript_14976/m.20945 type:complete len:207 (-) Transcript_14976:8-628(-)
MDNQNASTKNLAYGDPVVPLSTTLSTQQQQNNNLRTLCELASYASDRFLEIVLIKEPSKDERKKASNKVLSEDAQRRLHSKRRGTRRTTQITTIQRRRRNQVTTPIVSSKAKSVSVSIRTNAKNEQNSTTSDTGRVTPAQQVSIRSWLQKHQNNPFPTRRQMDILCNTTGCSRRQIHNALYYARSKMNHNTGVTFQTDVENQTDLQ